MSETPKKLKSEAASSSQDQEQFVEDEDSSLLKEEDYVPPKKEGNKSPFWDRPRHDSKKKSDRSWVEKLSKITIIIFI